MADDIKAVNAHYDRKNLGAILLRAIEEAGKDLNALRMEDLAPLEEFHIGGRKATFKLAELAGLSAGMKVLDIGCGIGGPARALAGYHGCVVTGIDLSEEYCSAGNLLTERVGLAGQVVLLPGSGPDLQFEAGSFDAVWMQHVSMNIRDKSTLFKEVARVLGSEGKLAFHEILAAKRPVAHFPVPWAGDPGINFMVPPEEMQSLLESTGFGISLWEDVTEASTHFFSRMLKATAERGLPPLNLSALIGPDFPLMAGNMLKNLEEKRMRVFQGVATLRS